MANLTRESFVEWAASWVPDDPPGQRARFAEAMTSELAHWDLKPKPPRHCKHCPFAEHLHAPDTLAGMGCPGFEADTEYVLTRHTAPDPAEAPALPPCLVDTCPPDCPGVDARCHPAAPETERET